MKDTMMASLLADKIDTLWVIEVIHELGMALHSANNHARYAPTGHAQYQYCQVNWCKLAHRIDELAGHSLASEDVAKVVCPENSAHIVWPLDDGTTFHCDDCHTNFVFKPEAKPFGGLSNSQFRAKLAQYIRELDGFEGTDRAILILASTLIEPTPLPEEN